MRETPIAFGLTMVICLALFFYCWYIRKLRNRLVSVQVSATPFEVNEKTGIEKDVVATFPTVKTHELRLNIKDELQCPICLVEYGYRETLRKLPHCGHVFHIHCVDAWLANQITCPVCRIELTKQPQLNAYNCSLRTPSSITIEVAPPTPAWVLVNRPLPLPPLESNDNSGPGLKGPIDVPVPTGWGAVFLQRTAFSFRSQLADTAIIESKDVISHSSISERWMTESFSFGKNPTEAEVAEMYSCSSQHGHLPLTASPEHCAFEFLPIVTARGSDSSSRRASR